MGAKFRGSRVVPAAAASSRPGFVSRMGAKFRGSRVVPAKAVGLRGPGLLRRSSSSSSSASSASRHSLASRASSRASSASSRSGSPSPRPPSRAGIAALAHAHGVVAHAPVRAGLLSRVRARAKSAFTRNPAKAVGVKGPGLLRRSSSSASSRHSSKSSVGTVGAVAPASPKKGLGALFGNLFSRKKQVTRKVRKSSSHSSLKRGLMAKGSYASSSSKNSSRSKLSSASHASSAATASTAATASSSKKSSNTNVSSGSISSLSASSKGTSSPKSLNSSWSSSSSSKKPKPKIMVKIKSPGAKGVAAALPVFFPGPPGFKSMGAAAAKGAAAKLAPVILAPVVSDASSSASSISSADSAASASPLINFDSPLAAAAASPKAVSAKGALESPRAVDMRKALYSSSSSSSKSASSKGASSKAAAVPSPKNSWSSSSGSKKHKAAIKFKIKSPGAKGGPAAFPIVFPGPPGFKYKGAVVSAAPVVVAASPKAVSAKGAALAPIIVIPSPAAATSLPALRKALADATQMLAVRKAIAVSEALAARTARTNKLPSADEKRREALAARTNFRDVKALVEKLSARVAAASAPMVVKAAAKGAAAKASAPMVVKAAPVILNVSSRNKRSSSSDGSPKKKTKKMKFSIKPLEKGAAPVPIVIVESPKGSIKGLSGVTFGPAATAAKAKGPVFIVPSISPKGKSSDSWSRNIGRGNISKVVVDNLGWEESPKAAPIVVVPSSAAAKAASPKAAAPVILNVSPQNQWSSSSDGSRKAKPKLKFSIKPLAKAASPKAASVEPLPPGWLGYMHPEPEIGAFYGKPEEDLGIWVRPKDRPVQVSAVPHEIAEFMKGQSKAHLVKGMRGQKSRKRSNPLLDLEKQLKEGMKKTKRLERYKRLIADGRRREAIQYMRKHNMLHEVMDMSHVVPVEDIGLDVVDIEQPSPSSKKGAPLGLRAQIKEPFVDLNLEVVNIDQPSPSSKKRSSSGSRKRANAKPISSPHSRKVDKGASFGKMAEALEKKAKQDAKQVVPFKPAPFVPKSTYVDGVRGAEAGKKGDKTVDALHKERVNLATSPTFKPYDPKKGKWM